MKKEKIWTCIISYSMQWILAIDKTHELVGGKSLENVSSHQLNDHVKRIMEAEKAFVEMDSRGRTLRIRNRTVMESEQGHLLCYCSNNRGRISALSQRLRPARVVFVEPSKTGVSTRTSTIGHEIGK